MPKSLLAFCLVYDFLQYKGDNWSYKIQFNFPKYAILIGANVLFTVFIAGLFSVNFGDGSPQFNSLMIAWCSVCAVALHFLSIRAANRFYRWHPEVRSKKPTFSEVFQFLGWLTVYYSVTATPLLLSILERW